MNKNFSVGVFRTDITPKVPLPLYGMGNDYVRKENFAFPSSEADRLAADTLVFSDGESKAVICTLDTLFIHEFFADPIRLKIGDALGIPPENIILTASHTHSGVSTALDDADVKEYLSDITTAIVNAAKNADADLSHAKIETGCIKVMGMNFERRFIMKDGSHRCTIADKTFNADDIASYETTPDNYLRALRFTREGKKDVLTVNWQAHPGFTPSFTKGNVSADYIGSMRVAAEEDKNTHFIYFQGAAGNMEARTRFKGDKFYETNRALDRDAYARELLRIVREDIPFTEAKSGAIKVCSKYISARQKSGKNVLEKTHTLPLSTISFGDIAICGAPNELYSDTGLDIRERSPYKMTLICTNANGYYGYLPIKACFDGESFCLNEKGDSFGVRVCKCECGTAEKIADTLVDMLKSH